MNVPPEIGIAVFGLGMLLVGAGAALLWASGRYGGRTRNDQQLSRLDFQPALDPGDSTTVVPHPMMTILDPGEPVAIARPQYADTGACAPATCTAPPPADADDPDASESSVVSIPVSRQHTRPVPTLRESVTLPSIPSARAVGTSRRHHPV